MQSPEQGPHPQPRALVLKEQSLANILKGYEEFRLDIFGKIISSNLEAVNVTGYEEWEVIGKHISMFYSTEAVVSGKVEHDLENARNSRKYSFTSIMIKKRQVAFWAKLTIRVIHDSSGSVIGYKVVLKDQTHRLISNTKLKKFKNEYRNLFDNPFIGIFKFRKDDHKVLLLNSKASHIIGDAVVGRFYEAFRHHDEFDALTARLNAAGKVVAFEFQLAMGKDRWARIDCQSFDEDGFVEGVITDVTESKIQLLELERLNADLDNFIYRASHDLRSPLTTLMGLINLLESDPDTLPEVYHAMMRDRVTHLDHLLADLAAITYNNKAELKLQQIDFFQVEKLIVMKYGAKASITFVNDAVDPFSCDFDRLLMIFEKLTSYSIRYCNPAHEVHELRIDISIVANEARITFRDNGRGMSRDQLAKAFELFHKPTNDVAETGLGLYMTKLMVDKLRGKIEIDSVIGEGTVISLQIPGFML